MMLYSFIPYIMGMYLLGELVVVYTLFPLPWLQIQLSRQTTRSDASHETSLTHFCPPLRFRNQVPTCDVRETDVSRHNGGTSGAPLKPLRDDSALRTLSSYGGTRGSPIMPRDAVSRTAHVGTVGKNGLMSHCSTSRWCRRWSTGSDWGKTWKRRGCCVSWSASGRGRRASCWLCEDHFYYNRELFFV